MCFISLPHKIPVLALISLIVVPVTLPVATKGPVVNNACESLSTFNQFTLRRLPVVTPNSFPRLCDVISDC